MILEPFLSNTGIRSPQKPGELIGSAGDCAAIWPREIRTAKGLLRRLNDWRQHKGVSHVFMYYNERSHTGMHQPVATQLLPIDPAFFAMIGKRPWRSRSLPTYSIDRETLFSGLIQQYLFVVILRACARSIANLRYL